MFDCSSSSSASAIVLNLFSLLSSFCTFYSSYLGVMTSLTSSSSGIGIISLSYWTIEGCCEELLSLEEASSTILFFGGSIWCWLSLMLAILVSFYIFWLTVRLAMLEFPSLILTISVFEFIDWVRYDYSPFESSTFTISPTLSFEPASPA